MSLSVTGTRRFQAGKLKFLDTEIQNMYKRKPFAETVCVNALMTVRPVFYRRFSSASASCPAGMPPFEEMPNVEISRPEKSMHDLANKAVFSREAQKSPGFFGVAALLPSGRFQDRLDGRARGTPV
jgi:hypothetical protein